jgi:hypothetical protein
MHCARLSSLLIVVLASLTSNGRSAETASTAETRPAGERSLVVGKQGYFPVALRLADGRIAVVLRGGAGHLGIEGRLDMVYSSDEGRTWTAPSVIVDSPADDRNPALGQAADGTIVVAFYRTEMYTDGKYDLNSNKPVSTWVTRSGDNGRSWSAPAAIDVADIGWGSPYGRIATLADGSMLTALYGGTVGGGPLALKRTEHSYVYRSTDRGQTWKRLSELGAGYGQFNETSLLEVSPGHVLAAMRSRAGAVWTTHSRDGAQTWEAPHELTPISVHPADLCRLADGRVLMTVGDRLEGFGVRAMLGTADGGFDWNKRSVLVDDSVSKDCGYPSSVLLKDGRVLTVYYSTAVKEHRDWGAHCGAVVTKFE